MFFASQIADGDFVKRIGPGEIAAPEAKFVDGEVNVDEQIILIDGIAHDVSF